MALSLLENLNYAANLMAIRPDNVVEVIQTLSAVTALRGAFNTTQIQKIFALERKFVLRASGASMDAHTVGLFVKVLGGMLDPHFLGDVIEEDFGAIPPAGNETSSLET